MQYLQNQINKQVTNETTLSAAILVNAGIMMAMSPIIILGNLMVLLAFCIDKNLRTYCYIIILVSMSLSDFLVGALGIPVMFYLYFASVKHESLWWGIPDLVTAVTSLHCALFVIERFVNLRWRLNGREYFSPKRIYIAIAFAWLLPFLYCIVLNFVWHFSDPLNSYYMSFDFAQLIFVYGFYVAPTVITTVLCSILIHQLRQNGGEMCREDKKMVWTLVFILILMIMGYIPNSIWWTLSLHMTSFAMTIIWILSNILQVAVAMIDPFLYAFRFRQFNSAFKKLQIKCCGANCCCRNNPENEEDDEFMYNDVLQINNSFTS